MISPVVSQRANSARLTESLKAAARAQVPMDKITISSDGQGSWSNYDADGRLVEMGVSDVDTIYRQIVYEVKTAKMPLAEALTYGTINVAKALELYPKKGVVREGSDGDLLLLNADLSMNAVIANGTVMMKDESPSEKGNLREIRLIYEKHWPALDKAVPGHSQGSFIGCGEEEISAKSRGFLGESLPGKDRYFREVKEIFTGR